MTTQELRWAVAERTLDLEAARRVRRTPGVVVGITGLLVLAVGVTAAVDLQRLKTPRGAALAWSQAAAFGDCRAYRVLSTPAPGRSCRELRDATAAARARPSDIALRATSVRAYGATADVTIEVRDPTGTRVVALHLVRRHGDWLVRTPSGGCPALRCP